MREGRIKPIDILSKHLDDSDDFEFEIDELDEPYMVFQVSVSCFREFTDIGLVDRNLL